MGCRILRLVESREIWFVSTDGNKHEPSLSSWFKMEMAANLFFVPYRSSETGFPYLYGDLSIYNVWSETNQVRGLALGLSINKTPHLWPAI
ncbi:hypothetical protein O6P43_005397 [Quillaja saponaria]|uniref:Uncharacterized protein n=1 Tax=Quillaja saponaria TaxID=32244 RepID=A0AAD7VHB6_QUISA|nr:hypothetical protein O6P43_005397 [Quillaja saponaria]